MSTDKDNKNNISCCYNCGAKIKREGNSLHAWDIEYECGCKIWGAIDNDGIDIEVDCPNSN